MSIKMVRFEFSNAQRIVYQHTIDSYWMLKD